MVVVGLDPGPGRPWLTGEEPLDDVDDGPLPPAVPAAWKAMTSGGSTGRPKLIVATTPGAARVRRRGRADDPYRAAGDVPLYRSRCTTTDPSFFP